MRILDRGTSSIQDTVSIVLFNVIPQCFDIVVACSYLAARMQARAAAAAAAARVVVARGRGRGAALLASPKASPTPRPLTPPRRNEHIETRTFKPSSSQNPTNQPTAARRARSPGSRPSSSSPSPPTCRSRYASPSAGVRPRLFVWGGAREYGKPLRAVQSIALPAARPPRKKTKPLHRADRRAPAALQNTTRTHHLARPPLPRHPPPKKKIINKKQKASSASA